MQENSLKNSIISPHAITFQVRHLGFNFCLCYMKENETRLFLNFIYVIKLNVSFQFMKFYVLNCSKQFLFSDFFR